MTHEVYIQCLIAALIGNLIHIGVKIVSLAKDHKLANLEFSFIGYLKDDKWALIVDLLSSVGLVYIIDEWLNDEWIAGKVKSIFFFVGFTGSYVVLQLMSVAKKKFRAAIDHKTNIADQVSGTLDKPTPK